jgi:hypothetical protein
MSNLKWNQVIKVSLVAFATVPLIWLASCEYPGQSFSQVSDVISSLVEVTVLIDALLPQKDSDTN